VQKRAETLKRKPPSARTKLETFREYLAKRKLELNPVTEAIAKLVERIQSGEELRVVVVTPPRHGKTETWLRAFAYLLRVDPSKTHAYTTYGADLSYSKSRAARRYSVEDGVTLDPASQSVKEWRTSSNGGLLATGAGGPLTGQGITGVGVIDDPYKNRQEAESGLIRERIDDWFRSVFYTRLEPGASAIVIHTRWHPNDLAGRLIKEGWEAINLPAINESGEALWPERFPIEALRDIEEAIGPYEWASLYQGRPRPKGGAVFHEPARFDQHPAAGYREAHGFDGAYTAKTRADYSVALTARVKDGLIYVTGMLREQRESDQIIEMLKARGIKRVTWMRSGTEKGLEQFLRHEGVRVDAVTATGDKFARAQPAAAAWNAGKILLPSTASEFYGPWVAELRDEIETFTGLSDNHDDIVDALAALHHALLRSQVQIFL